MRPRTLGRRLALQYLFMADVNNFSALQPVESFFYLQRWSAAEASGKLSDAELILWEEENPKNREAEEFAFQIIVRVLEKRENFDKEVSRLTHNWALNRIGLIERNVLRLALAEFDLGETPVKVVINEAIELAKCFADDEAGKFVNGILDKGAEKK